MKWRKQVLASLKRWFEFEVILVINWGYMYTIDVYDYCFLNETVNTCCLIVYLYFYGKKDIVG